MGKVKIKLNLDDEVMDYIRRISQLAHCKLEKVVAVLLAMEVIRKQASPEPLPPPTPPPDVKP